MYIIYYITRYNTGPLNFVDNSVFSTCDLSKYQAGLHHRHSTCI